MYAGNQVSYLLGGKIHCFITYLLLAEKKSFMATPHRNFYDIEANKIKCHYHDYFLLQ